MDGFGAGPRPGLSPDIPRQRCRFVPAPRGKPGRAVVLFFAVHVQGVGGQRESVVVKIKMQELLGKQ